MSAIETIRFKGDTPARKRLMVPSSFAHPAKGQLGMWALMIERYSKESDLVLDPMAGIGTSLIAALMGRNVICVELERHFVEPMRQSWEKMRNMPMLGYQVGQAVILWGDARAAFRIRRPRQASARRERAISARANLKGGRHG